MEEKRRKILQRILCGCAVGLANSVFGGGGGMLAVPLLQKTGWNEKEAHATAILLILPISLFSFSIYVVRGAYDCSVLIPTSLGVTIGGLFGAKLLGRLPTKTVRLIFCALQIAAGVFLWLQSA